MAQGVDNINKQVGKGSIPVLLFHITKTKKSLSVVKVILLEMEWATNFPLNYIFKIS